MLFVVPLLFTVSFADEAPPVSDAPKLDPESGVSEERAPTFTESLELAKKRYFQGRQQEALALLLDLQLQVITDTSGAIAIEEASEAMVFAGEIQFMTGNVLKARDAWRWVLERDVDFPALSPFSHPPEVGNEFEAVRRVILEEIALRPEPVIPPTPAWSVLPLGIPQFVDGRPVRGLLYGGVQVGLGVTSVAMLFGLRDINVSDDPHPRGWTDAEMQQRVNTMRYAVQWPATLGFYAAWGTSWFDARNRWQQTHTPVQVGWTPAPHSPARFALTGRF